MRFPIRTIAFLVLASALAPQLPAADERIAARVDDSRRVAVKGHVHPLALPQYDQGPVDAAKEMRYVTMLLKPAAGLELFLAGQQSASSPDYHRWLTPEQFADRFGLVASDIGKLVSWLESQGLKVNGVARGRHWIAFSGPAGRMGRALGTEFHRYRVNGETHIANTTEPSVPAAFESVVAGFRGLHDFRLKPLYVTPMAPLAGPEFNSGGSHFLAPEDFATIYGVNALYSAGFDGSGQSIVIVGQTDIVLADLQAFRKRFGLPANDPEVVVVGGADGDPGISGGDLVEADLDLEWAGAVAKSAHIIYVNSFDVGVSAQYAIDQNLAPVISMSYGGCEQENSPGLRALAQQAAAQGITWIAASGDQGAATCDISAPTPQAAKGRTVTFPASIPEITAVGGTTFNEGSGTYWSAANSPNLGSALSYIPEKVWNDSAARNDLAAAGGGASIVFPKPVWQAGPGVPNDSARDVPDVSLSASPDHVGYAFNTGGKTGIVGGTSAGTPAFAGIVALLNQYLTAHHTLAQPGLGNINPMLYRLAQAAPQAFHDVATGDNMVPCAQNSPDCVNGLAGYSAAAGYDLASGLGSVDAFQLASQWNTGTASTTTLAANPGAINLGDTVQLTATVTGAAATPTGTITFIANDTLLGTAPLASAGAAATASLAANSVAIAAGNGTVTAMYSGDAVYNASAGTATVALNLPASGSLVVLSVSPDPVPETTGPQWPYTLTVRERAGVATKLTKFTINGVNNLSVFDTTDLPANGTMSLALAGSGLTPPIDRVFILTGADADGRTWTQQITVPFVAPVNPVIQPSITLTSTPAAIQQNPLADASCQWSQQLTVQEQGGFLTRLTGFTAGGTDFSTQIQTLFGTTRLAPYGTLQATMCWSNISTPATKSYVLTGASELGPSVTATMSTSFAAASSGPAAFSVAPATVNLSVADAPQNAAATLTLNFAGGTPSWTVSVLPSNRTTSWLTVPTPSGTGPAQVKLQASAAGLSHGVYQATLAIQADNAVPQSLLVPVVFVVGASSTTSIGGLQNAFSFQSNFAPGMLMSVYGTQLSSATRQASALPLPLTLSGVSATVNGVTAPLWFVSPGQLNIQIPYETGLGTAIVAVNNNGQVASLAFPVAVAAHGIALTAPNQPPVILNPAGAVVTSASPGQILTLFSTGEGDVTPTLATGAAPTTTTISRLPKPRLPLTVSVGGPASGSCVEC
ncbi:MAG: Ig-like domain repeat protein [Acidobacteriia bacterium]|nr:Ig-like domain repeat protein [Terriglobia bacterium]